MYGNCKLRALSMKGFLSDNRVSLPWKMLIILIEATLCWFGEKKQSRKTWENVPRFLLFSLRVFVQEIEKPLWIASVLTFWARAYSVFSLRIFRFHCCKHFLSFQKKRAIFFWEKQNKSRLLKKLIAFCFFVFGKSPKNCLTSQFVKKLKNLWNWKKYCDFGAIFNPTCRANNQRWDVIKFVPIIYLFLGKRLLNFDLSSRKFDNFRSIRNYFIFKCPDRRLAPGDAIIFF